MGAGGFCRLYNLIIGCIKSSITNILHNSSGKEVCLLKNEAQGSSEILFLDLININAVITDLTVSYVVETVDKVGDSCLSRTGCAYESDFLTRLGKYGNIEKDLFSRYIFEINVIKQYVTLKLRIGDRTVSLVRVRRIFPLASRESAARHRAAMKREWLAVR